MDPRFSDIFSQPENSIFHVVFYPDRIYHAAYLNATRSSRYRYNVREVRNTADITLLKGQVFMDGLLLSNFLRIEYRAGRLVEQARERGRLLQGELLAWLRLLPDNSNPVEATVKLHYCRWIDAYQVEIWQTLEPVARNRHDFKVLDMMGIDNQITRINTLNQALSDIDTLRQVELAFRENDRDLPFGYNINNPAWDNNFQRNYQAPNSPQPNSPQNTVQTENYLINFQRGWYLEADQVAPVRYENAMMNQDDPERAAGNVIEMRWLLQRELGSNMVFFHEVTIPPGKVEGTHRHIGSEELYYVTEGNGVAYMGENDDPKLSQLPVVKRSIFGLDEINCREIPVKPGSIIYTKSGGIHGIRNNSNQPLKFVAFLYHGR